MPRRNKSHSRGEHVFTDPHKEAQYQRELLAQGYGKEHSKQVAKDWAKVAHERTDRASSHIRAEDENRDEGIVPITNDTAGFTVKEKYPKEAPIWGRTRGYGYDQARQILRIAWGDNGTDYYYYNVTPQLFDSFEKASSKGRWINAIGNSLEYGPIE
jgi:hypothetical protein